MGDTLHIVTEEWKNEATEWKGWNFNYSTVLSSFDLEDPEEIKKTSEITTAGSPQVIFATNEKLAVVTRGLPLPASHWWQRLLEDFLQW